MTESHTHENRLARETSPYLQQHKHNPVDWWPWGPEALAQARRYGKPILLSVGYAACHWCHVMAHESFEDAETAGVMNNLFVNIKVDREERPDIDQIYMSALHLLGEQGGWPLTMFLTSAGEPFWGGTYFPNTARYGRPAFTDVLREVARLYREDPAVIDQNRKALMARLSEQAQPKGRIVIGPKELDRAAVSVGGLIDPTHGGLRGAPKFPQCSMFELLWRAGRRTGEARYYEAVEHTLERICQGGIYDHLGGGFSRYSVDERWLVPHFEKMLYDNAQLLELLAVAYARSRNPLFRVRAHETVDWLMRDMRTPEGVFAASLDADSEGEEGKYYVWTQDEIVEHLGPDDGAFFCHHYDVTRDGNFEGHAILNRLGNTSTTEDDELRLAILRAKLLAIRSTRVPPGLDDKILADWNGLAIAALVNASILFDTPVWRDAAQRAFDFIATRMTRDGRLGHSWRGGKLLLPGLASDFTNMIRAALALAEATGEGAYLDQAVSWQSILDDRYGNAQTGGYYLTADDAEGLVVRPNATTDEATPNPNAVGAQNLVRLAAMTGDDRYRVRADALFDGVLAVAAENLFAHTALLNAVDTRIRLAEIVVTGEGAAAQALIDAALREPFIDRVVTRASFLSDPAAEHPARAAIASTAGVAAFFCLDNRCSLPVRGPHALGDALARMRGTA